MTRNHISRWVGVTGLALAAVTLSASSASAAPPEYPHGVGVCISQVAIDPSLGGADNLGQLVSATAGPQSPGSDMPTALETLRGDGPGGCGAPPGPRHLG